MTKESNQGKNGYIALYKSKRVEVWAETSYAAQKQAQAALKLTPKQACNISIFLCEKAGEPVTHTPDF